MMNDPHPHVRPRLPALSIALFAGIFAAGCSNAPDTKLKLPMGYMDVPAQNAVLKGTVSVAGWALSEDGVDKVAVYVDRSFNGYAKVSGQRPDVVKVHPEFANTPDMQWVAQLDTAAIPVGSHEVLARAIGKKGSVRDLGAVLVTVEH